MSKVGEKLPRERFLPIHRSALMNLEAACELAPNPHADFVVALKSGSGCLCYRDRLEEALLVNVRPGT